MRFGNKYVLTFSPCFEASARNFRKTRFLAFRKSANNGHSSRFLLASKQGKERFETHLFPSLVLPKLDTTFGGKNRENEFENVLTVCKLRSLKIKFKWKFISNNKSSLLEALVSSLSTLGRAYYEFLVNWEENFEIWARFEGFTWAADPPKKSLKVNF